MKKEGYNDEYKNYFSISKLLNGYSHIGITEGVCGNEPVIIGTRIEPKYVAAYGTIEETMKDFDLTMEQVMEAINYTYGHLKENH